MPSIEVTVITHAIETQKQRPLQTPQGTTAAEFELPGSYRKLLQKNERLSLSLLLRRRDLYRSAVRYGRTVKGIALPC